MPINLTIPTGTFDRDSHFAFEYTDRKGNARRSEGYVFDCAQEGVTYLMQSAACLQSSYSDTDRQHLDRIYNGPDVVRHGDAVTINGKPYTVKVLGNYSDAGRFIPA